MTTAVSNDQFVGELIDEIILPAAEQLMQSRYFTDLRAGTLTMRRLQGYSLQHTWFNRALLKSGAIRMIKASDNPQAFASMIEGIVAGSTTTRICASSSASTSASPRRTSKRWFPSSTCSATRASSLPLRSSTIRPRREPHPASRTKRSCSGYSTELFNYLKEAPVQHAGGEAGILPHPRHRGHRAYGASAGRPSRPSSAPSATEGLVRDSAVMQLRLKLAKFEGIYDAYA